MPTRYDVSGVRPQGGYIAKQCPGRAQWDVLRPGEALAPSPVLERRFRRGLEFEASIIGQLQELHPSAVRVEASDVAQGELETATAMAGGVELVIGGRLPVGEAGRRVGEPDLLVAVPGSASYRAVDIKHHLTLEPANDAVPSRRSSLEDLAYESATEDPAFTTRKRKSDLLQLAHYQRMLEELGLAAADDPADARPSPSPGEELEATRRHTRRVSLRHRRGHIHPRRTPSRRSQRLQLEDLLVRHPRLGLAWRAVQESRGQPLRGVGRCPRRWLVADEGRRQGSATWMQWYRWW